MPQEARALRFAPAAARAVALRGAFCHGGHVCLVLQRLVPSLLDYVVDSAALAPAARLANLRALALQLLVRARGRLWNKNASALVGRPQTRHADMGMRGQLACALLCACCLCQHPCARASAAHGTMCRAVQPLSRRSSWWRIPRTARTDAIRPLMLGHCEHERAARQGTGRRVRRGGGAAVRRVPNP